MKLALALMVVAAGVAVCTYFVVRRVYVVLTSDTVQCLYYEAEDVLRRKDVKVLTQTEVDELAAGLGTASVSHVWKDANGVTVDPWGNRFLVRCKATHAGLLVEAISLGPDHAPDTADDIDYSGTVPK